MRQLVFKIAAAAGLLALILGTVLYPVAVTGDALPTILFVAGAGVLVVSALANLGALVAYFRKRSARHGANAVLMTLLFTAILIVIQAISIRNTRLLDVTSNKRFTLSDQTMTLLERLDTQIEITAFVRRHTTQWTLAESLLRMYEQQSRRVSVALVDPDQKPHVAERYRARGGDVVVEYRGNQRLVSGVTEEKITNALMFASREGHKTVYFVKGHDEKRLDGPENNGFLSAKRGLEGLGFLVFELSLVDVDSIPRDCSVLVVAGPKKEYLQYEAVKIAAYLEGGGNALFLLDPRWPISQLLPILARYHIAADNLVLLDELVIVDTGDEVFDATYTKIRRYEPHPITRDFRSITIFPVARPLAVVPVEGDLSVHAQYLAITERSAWGETDIESYRMGTATRDETDVRPPLAVAAVAERTNRFDVRGGAPPSVERTSRIVVIGDSDFATNRFYRLLGNSDFFLNAVEYLAEEEIVVPIRLKAGLGDSVFISAAEGRLIFVLCLILLPLMVASMGGYVILKKRRS